MLAEHLGMRRKIFVDLDDAAAHAGYVAIEVVVAGIGAAQLTARACINSVFVEHDLHGLHPWMPTRFLPFSAAVEDQDVDDDIRAGGCTHAAFGHAGRRR
jgi:hypothetical protein